MAPYCHNGTSTFRAASLTGSDGSGEKDEGSGTRIIVSEAAASFYQAKSFHRIRACVVLIVGRTSSLVLDPGPRTREQATVLCHVVVMQYIPARLSSHYLYPFQASLLLQVTSHTIAKTVPTPSSRYACVAAAGKPALELAAHKAGAGSPVYRLQDGETARGRRHLAHHITLTSKRRAGDCQPDRARLLRCVGLLA